MEHFLDIIVPEYNCKEEFMKRLLHSISRQKKVDFAEIGVIIVNDNSSNKIRKGLFKNFPTLNIEYYIKETNDGVGMTRQYGLDRSSAKYVTFVDQDDELYDDYSIHNVINYLKNTELNYVLSYFVEEVVDIKGNIRQKLCDENDGRQTLHGVFIKRQFMIDNDVKFVPGFRVHDDYYMRGILRSLEVVPFLNFKTYLWKYNSESQVRTKNRKYAYMVETFDEYFRAIEALNEYRQKHNSLDARYIMDTVMSLFVVLNSSLFNFPELHDEVINYRKRLYEMTCKYNKEMEILIDSSEKYYNSQVELSTSTNKNFSIVKNESIQDFIDEMNKMNYPGLCYKKMVIDRLLDIIVPYYDINKDNIDRIISSICNQVNVSLKKFGVIIVFNKSIPYFFSEDKYKKQFEILNVEYYSYDGEQSLEEYGMMLSKAKYNTILNQYDMLNGPDVLKKLDELIENNDYELISTDYFVYDPVSKGKNYISPDFLQSINGLMFNRNEVISKYKYINGNIFYEKQFVDLLYQTFDIKYCNFASYVWIINQNNFNYVNNISFDYIVENISDYIRINIDTFNKLDSNHKLNYEFLISNLYEMKLILSNIIDNSVKSILEEEIHEFFLKHKDSIINLSNELKNDCFNRAVNKIRSIYQYNINVSDYTRYEF